MSQERTHGRRTRSHHKQESKGILWLSAMGMADGREPWLRWNGLELCCSEEQDAHPERRWDCGSRETWKGRLFAQTSGLSPSSSCSPHQFTINKWTHASLYLNPIPWKSVRNNASWQCKVVASFVHKLRGIIIALGNCPAKGFRRMSSWLISVTCFSSFPLRLLDPLYLWVFFFYLFPMANTSGVLRMRLGVSAAAEFMFFFVSLPHTT